MPGTTKATKTRTSRRTRAAVTPWTKDDVRTLKKLAGAEPRRKIARALKRTEAAVTFKAFKLRLSLAQKNRPRRTTVRKAR
jgi:hypothetical protein